MPKVKVLFDSYRLVDPETGDIVKHSKGDVIEVSADEFKRGKEIGGLAVPSSGKKKDDDAATDDSAGATDETTTS